MSLQPVLLLAMIVSIRLLWRFQRVAMWRERGWFGGTAATGPV